MQLAAQIKNYFCKKTKLQLKNWAKRVKKRLKTVIYIGRSIENFFHSEKVIHWTRDQNFSLA